MRRAKGLSLIEVIISVGILSVIITFVAVALSGGLRISRDNQLNAAANSYVQAVIEEIRGAWVKPENYSAAIVPNLTQFNSKLPTGFSTPVIDVTGQLNADGTNFTGTGVPPMRRVVVSVSYGGRVRAKIDTRVGNPKP